MSIKYIDKTIIFLLTYYLLIDSLNGFLLLGLGLDFKLSVIYKSIVLVLIILALINLNARFLIWGLTLFIALILGEATKIFLGLTAGDQIFFVIQHIFKLLTPLMLFIYLKSLIKKNYKYIDNVKHIIKINCIVYLVNILLGLLGFGFSTYGGDVNESSIGVKGFFYAGNEISMLMVVFSAYFLGEAYKKNKLHYLLGSIVWIVVGFAISTKTAMIATLMLVIFIPVIIERKALINFSSKKFYYFYSFLAVFVVVFFMLLNSFMESNIYTRLVYIYNKQGVWGILLSGRDEFLSDLLEMFFYNNSVYNLMFGNGISFYAEKLKESTELDFPDIFLWHGIFGVLIVLGIFFTYTRAAISRCTNNFYPYASIVLFTNVLLIIVSNISGHVFTSGMLGFLWPCFCILSFIKEPSYRQLGKL